MLMKNIIAISLLFIALQTQAQQRIIFDSDFGPDYDDVGAITLLHAFADKGDATILATIASDAYPNAAASLNIFNTYFKRPNIPVGVVKNNAVNISDWQHWSDTLIKKYPHTITSNNEAQDAITLYRKILSQQPDSSVTIVSVGFLTNLAALIQSHADEYSPLNGTQLISKKVKRLVSMAGSFPGGDGFTEFNVMKDVAAAKTVFENWPAEVIYSGFEIGSKIKTGLPLTQNNNITNSPVKDVFSICLPMAKEDHEGRMSWDETAVLVAVKGAAPLYNLHAGKMIVHADGSNSWDEQATGQFYLVAKADITVVANIINTLMQHTPAP
jgi:inosine-uridine nucleoside N-ribohydrolase